MWQFALLVVSGAVVVLGCAGLALAVGIWRWRKRKLAVQRDYDGFLPILPAAMDAAGRPDLGASRDYLRIFCTSYQSINQSIDQSRSIFTRFQPLSNQ